MEGISSTKTQGSPGKKPEHDSSTRQVVRDLRRKGQTIEALAVGFGVSYNTIRAYLAEPDLNKDALAASTCAGPLSPLDEAE